MFATTEQATEDSTGPDPLVLSEVQPKTFLALLEFIYTNCCSLSTDIVSSQYRYSHTLRCELYYLQVIDVLAASIEYGLDGLTQAGNRYFSIANF